jgi:hypothetical protein
MRRSFSLAALLVAITTVSLLPGCGGGSSGGGARAGNPNSSELFDRSYGYLIKGDPDFPRYAPNYSSLRPFSRDSALAIQMKSEAEGVANPATDYAESFVIRVHRAMGLRVVVADSAGNGLITYEFPNLTEGDFTLGTKGWPTPQTNAVFGNPFIYVYFVGDQRFRARYKLGLDDKRRLTYMPQPPPAS